MDKPPIGEELNQLARFLFDAAARKWYFSIALEIVAGLVSVGFSIVPATDDGLLVGATAGAILLASAYVFRIRFEDEYDTAETMRRQSVLTEALGWSVEKIQMSEWRQKAGRHLRRQLQVKHRDADYYSSDKTLGSERLAEITIQSAFFTRHLYLKLHSIIWFAFVLVACSLFLVISTALGAAIPASVDLVIARAVMSFIPVVLAIDILGWGIRLGRVISALRDIEAALERLVDSGQGDLPAVLRLVSEYNCQVVAGIPVLNRLYIAWAAEINELWSNR